MQNPFKGRGALLTVGAATAIVVLAGGTGAVAGSLVTSAKIKDGTIQSVDVRNDTLRSVDVRNNSLGSVDVLNNSLTGTDIKDWSLTNQDVGVLFASVEGNATLDASSGGVTVSDKGTGQYGVRFAGRDLRKCAFSATVGDLGGGSTTGQATVADLAGEPDGVFVWTQDTAGGTVDRDFHLIVVC